MRRPPWAGGASRPLPATRRTQPRAPALQPPRSGGPFPGCPAPTCRPPPRGHPRARTPAPRRGRCRSPPRSRTRPYRPSLTRRSTSSAPASRPVLLVADLLHPVDGLAALLFLDRDVGHAGGGRGAVPVLLAGCEPDHVARPDLFHRYALALRPAAAGGDDQGLAERMGVPGRPRPRLEGDH